MSPGERSARTSATILRLVRPGSRVLDIGCGEGALLDLLARGEGRRRARPRDQPAEGSPLAWRGGWRWCRATPTTTSPTSPAAAFDYAILSQTLQTVREPRHVLAELLRIAERAIVSLPNFAHWRVRFDLLAAGRMPITGALPSSWWATGNIHLCTLRDFTELCDDLGLRIEACAALADGKPARPIDPKRPLENWRAETAIFLLSRNGSAPAGTTHRAAPRDLFS